MQAFRTATCTLLGEYTDHYKRQRIDNASLREARGTQAEGKLEGSELSLAEAVYLDRLDRVQIQAGGSVQMASL